MIEAVNQIKAYIESIGYTIKHHVPSMTIQQKDVVVLAIGYEMTTTETDMCGRKTVTFICTIDAIAPQRTENDNWFIETHKTLTDIGNKLLELTKNGKYQSITAITHYDLKTLGIDSAMRSAYQLRLNVITDE